MVRRLRWRRPAERCTPGTVRSGFRGAPTQLLFWRWMVAIRHLGAAGLVGLIAAACSFGSLDELSGTPGAGGADAGTNDAGTDASPDAAGGTSGTAGAGGGLSGGGGGWPTSLDNGALCKNADDCKSGFCVGGICCDQACDIPCMACTAANKESAESDGLCGPAKAGTDPADDCSDAGESSCGTDGKCDGSGACRVYPSGTPCGAGSCSNGVKTLARLCDGAGSCVDSGTQPCMPAVCAGDVCSGDCVGDGSCTGAKFCDSFSGACTDKFVDGGSCGRDGECASGHCVDGVCCDTACQGACMACSAELSSGANGVCSPTAAGTDPDDECSSSDATTCGQDGECDGAGACRRHAAGTPCAASTCGGTTQTNGKTCDGSGTCESNGTTDCSPFKCGTTSCRSSCTSDTHCVSTSFCSGNQCQGKKSNGATCTNASQCTSGFCVDGRCCNSACTGSCKACSAAAKGTGANGVCGNVASGQDPHNDCSQQAASTCGRDGTCNGSGGCRKWPAGTVCNPGSCELEPMYMVTYQQHYPDTCDGSGTCEDKGLLACGLYTCNGNQCRTSCSNTSHCTFGTCLTSSGTCYFNPGPF